MQTQQHSCLMNIHRTYPQFCRFPSRLRRRKIFFKTRTLNPWTLHTGTVFKFSLPCLHSRLRYFQFYSISKFLCAKVLFNPHVARHRPKMDFHAFSPLLHSRFDFLSFVTSTSRRQRVPYSFASFICREINEIFRPFILRFQLSVLPIHVVSIRLYNCCIEKTFFGVKTL